MRSPAGAAARRAPGPLAPRWFSRPRTSGGVLARLVEPELGPALEGQLQIHARRGEIDERARVIHGEVLECLGAEFLELARVARHPARRVHVHAVEHAVHAVFVFETE